jgi:hypothetical protein
LPFLNTLYLIFQENPMPIEEDDLRFLAPLITLEKAGGAFCPVQPMSKKPSEANWQLTPYTVTEILPHLTMGGNVGLLVGRTSLGLCVLDLDCDLPRFLATFPELQNSPRITRWDAPERAKILIKVEGDIPPPKKWKPDSHLPPRAEWLSTGNQALVPPSFHPHGTAFIAEHFDQPIPTLTPEAIDRLWHRWTGNHLLAPETQHRRWIMKAQQGAEATEATYSSTAELKNAICQRFHMVNYACQVLNTTAIQEGDEWRILGQGGLLIDMEQGRWNTFGEDGTGRTGGDCFDLIAYLHFGFVRPTGQEWREVLRLAAAHLGIEVVKNHAPLDPNRHTPDTAPLALRGTMPLRQVWATLGELQRIWGGWLISTIITLVGGVPGVGKSTFVLKVVAEFLQGRLPDGSPLAPEYVGRNVVYYFPEGFAEQSTYLQTWGVPDDALDRIHVPYQLEAESSTAPNVAFMLDDTGRQALSETCEATQPALIVIDGLRSAMVGEEGSSKDSRDFFSFLIDLAAKHKAAIILTHHLTKSAIQALRNGQTPTSDMVRGSTDIIAKCRSAIILDTPDPTSPHTRRVSLVRASAGGEGQEFAFHMSDPAAGITFLESAPQPPAATKKAEAEAFYLEAIAEEPKTYQEIVALAEEAGLGISESTLRYARIDLSKAGKIRQVTVGKRYLWQIVPAISPTLEGVQAERVG